jgi:ABC-type multidrug transport system fused ATPase/permease subunit
LSYQLILNKKVECPDIKNEPLKEWPMNGSVEFVNYSAKYKDDLDYALKNLNLTIKPKEKVNINADSTFIFILILIYRPR